MSHPHVIQSNPIIQLMLNCQFGSSKVDRRMGYVWLSEVMTGFCGGIRTARPQLEYI